MTKKIVPSKNAVKHGIFSEDLIIDKGDGKESLEKYEMMYQGLLDSLAPSNALEEFLVEKITVDFWRLKRLLRYEKGSIRSFSDHLKEEHYQKEDFLSDKKLSRKNSVIDEEIEELKSDLGYTKQFLSLLKKGEIDLGFSEYEKNGFWIDLDSEFRGILKSIYKNKSMKENDWLDNEILDFNKIKELLIQEGFDDSFLGDVLLENQKKHQNLLEEKIQSLHEEKEKNQFQIEVGIQRNSLPQERELEKIMRYEKALQKSIQNNLDILQKLQGSNYKNPTFVL